VTVAKTNMLTDGFFTRGRNSGATSQQLMAALFTLHACKYAYMQNAVQGCAAEDIRPGERRGQVRQVRDPTMVGGPVHGCSAIRVRRPAAPGLQYV